MSGAPRSSYLHYHVAPTVGRAVVDHGHDGHAQVAADAKADAETQTAHDGDDVAAREAKAGAVHHRRVPRVRGHWTPVGAQFQRLRAFLPLLQEPAGQREAKAQQSPSLLRVTQLAPGLTLLGCPD